MKKMILFCGLFFSGVMVLTLSGCMSGQSTMEGIQGATGKLPFVEAYVEFPGPQEKWAGPPSFILHVSARGEGNAKLQVTPRWLSPAHAPESPTVSRRRLASIRLSNEQAREKLQSMASEIAASKATFRGCLYPVRVRLIRADGSLFEKSGCRDVASWSHSASTATNFFLSAASGVVQD